MISLIVPKFVPLFSRTVIISLHSKFFSLSASFRMPGKVPDRWEDYSNIGGIIEGTRLLAFKVPLEERICSNSRMPKEMWFTPQDLVQQVQAAGGQSLGHVVDLTNTKRYYDRQVLLDMGLGYDKVFTEGHVVPSRAVRKNFFKILETFLEQNSDNDKLLGVHCTHGVNRTGYLLCRYMIDRMQFSPEDAINAFNKARGHQLERENYLADLRKGVSEDVDDDTEPESIKERPTYSQWKQQQQQRRQDFSSAGARNNRTSPARSGFHGDQNHSHPNFRDRGHHRGHQGGVQGRGQEQTRWGHPNEQNREHRTQCNGFAPQRGSSHNSRGQGHQDQGQRDMTHRGYRHGGSDRNRYSDRPAGGPRSNYRAANGYQSGYQNSHQNSYQSGYRNSQWTASQNNSRQGYQSGYQDPRQRSSWGQGSGSASQDDYGSFGRRHDDPGQGVVRSQSITKGSRSKK